MLQAHYKYADPDGRNCRATVATIQGYLWDISESSVKRHRATLREKGWLRLRQRGRNTGGGSVASLFDVVIPSGSIINAPRPPRAKNRTGENQHTKAQRVTQSTPKPNPQRVTKPLFPEAQGGSQSSLPYGPLQGSSEVLPLKDVGGPSGEQGTSGSAGADRKVAGSKNGLAGCLSPCRPHRHVDHCPNNPWVASH